VVQFLRHGDLHGWIILALQKGDGFLSEAQVH
jgi:hypothetical protein